MGGLEEGEVLGLLAGGRPFARRRIRAPGRKVGSLAELNRLRQFREVVPDGAEGNEHLVTECPPAVSRCFPA